jgi:hypothetical protein
MEAAVTAGCCRHIRHMQAFAKSHQPTAKAIDTYVVANFSWFLVR